MQGTVSVWADVNINASLTEAEAGLTKGNLATYYVDDDIDVSHNNIRNCHTIINCELSSNQNLTFCIIMFFC